MPRRFIPYLKWPVAASIVLAFLFGLWAFPMSYWLEVRMVHINDSRVGDPITMLVDRVVKRSFTGIWAVGVYAWNGRAFVPHCTAHGRERPYKQGAEYPEPLTLKWWTEDEPACRSLPAGQYMVTTRWVNTGNEFPLPDKSVSKDSNIFAVRP